MSLIGGSHNHPFAWHMLTHVRKIAILRSDQVRPAARGDIGLLLGSSLIADRSQGLRRGLRNTGPDGERGQENERQNGG